MVLKNQQKSQNVSEYHCWEQVVHFGFFKKVLYHKHAAFVTYMYSTEKWFFFSVHIFFFVIASLDVGMRSSSVVEHLFMVRTVIGSIPHGGPIEQFLVLVGAPQLV